MSVEVTYKLAFDRALPETVIERLSSSEGRALGVTDWSISDDWNILLLETTQSVFEVIKFIAPLIEVTSLKLITQTMHYEPNWFEELS